jgi:hypothetical protein
MPKSTIEKHNALMVEHRSMQIEHIRATHTLIQRNTRIVARQVDNIVVNLVQEEVLIVPPITAKTALLIFFERGSISDRASLM